MDDQQLDYLSRARWVWWGGVAAITGGIMCVTKATAILIGGDQPPYLFEAAPLAFALALLALGALLDGRSGRATRTGLIVAVAVIAATVANVAEEIFTKEEWIPAASSAVDLVGGVGPPVGLILFGWALRRGRTFFPAPRPGPLAVAVLYPLAALLLSPVAIFVNLDGPNGERLIELPILAIGLGWAALGAGLVQATEIPCKTLRPTPSTNLNG